MASSEPAESHADEDSEDAAQRAEANFRRLLDDSPDGIVVHRAGKIIYLNDTALTMFGYARDEVIGRSPLEFVMPEYRDVVARRMKDSYTSGARSSQIEERYRRRDGSEIPVEVVSIPLLYEGEPASLAHCRDISLRKWLEAQLVTFDRLATVGTLASAIAHEINTPLTYALAGVDVARRRLDDLTTDPTANVGAALDDIREAVEHIAAVVRDVGLLSRDVQAQSLPVDLRVVLAACTRMVDPLFRGRARFSTRIEQTPLVLGSSSHLAQIFLNLLTNAAQAIPEGAPSDNEVSVTAYGSPTNAVVVEVRDTGAGIPNELRMRIFEPFFTTKTDRGTGLGLAIVKSLVTSLGGQIEIESEVGKGTCFRVTLPAAAVSATAASASDSTAAAPSHHILVVDAEPRMATVLRHTLVGHSIVSADTAVSALERIGKEGPFDAIVVDVTDEGTAMSFHDMVTTRFPGVEQRIVFLTGGPLGGVSSRRLASLPNHEVEKPFRPADLVRVVEEVARHRR